MGGLRGWLRGWLRENVAKVIWFCVLKQVFAKLYRAAFNTEGKQMHSRAEGHLVSSEPGFD